MCSPECLHHRAAVRTRCRNENDALKRETQELRAKRPQAVSICLTAGSSGERMKKLISDGVNEASATQRNMTFHRFRRAPELPP